MDIFEFNKAPDEMDDDELRSTLSEFMTKHEDNVADYSEIESERDELSETVADLEGEIADFSETESTLVANFAEVVASETEMFDADEVADRFSLSELIGKADAMGSFSLDTDAAAGDDDDDDDDDGGDEGTTFDEKPDRAPTGSGGSGGSSFSDQAEDDLNSLLSL
ncbi:hypothetical protein [Halonotius roseus]|uniref:Uncharacterized protein n=1 Tax=Halonotius roseus TaxID=2511997 RepID=A0A544QQZ4_9EURY|nr:hypothetical protein [Halonotius roseus]TQQ81859.1 hypothetical protein EWF95_02675 [Halonotius roseus]